MGCWGAAGLGPPGPPGPPDPPDPPGPPGPPGPLGPPLCLLRICHSWSCSFWGVVVLVVELLVAGWELVIAVLTLVVVWVVMAVPGRRGLFLISMGDVLRFWSIGAKQICWFIEVPGSLSSSSLLASDALSSLEVLCQQGPVHLILQCCICLVVGFSLLQHMFLLLCSTQLQSTCPCICTPVWDVLVPFH